MMISLTVGASFWSPAVEITSHWCSKTNLFSVGETVVA